MDLSDIRLPQNAARAQKLQGEVVRAPSELKDKVLLYGLLGIIAELEARIYQIEHPA